jgi:hypothetical protein
MACDVPAENLRAARISNADHDRISVSILEESLDFFLDARNKRKAPRRSGGGLPMGKPHGHLSTSPAAREDAVLGVADAAALRPVLGDPQHEEQTPDAWWRSRPSTTSTSCRRPGA